MQPFGKEILNQQAQEISTKSLEHNSEIISNASNNQVFHEANIELNNTSPIGESSLFGTIQEMIDQLNQNVSGLTLEQYACFVNTIALLIIFSSINAITAIFYGDKIIKYLKLEDKFPKLTKWIEYRRTFQNYFFIYNIILIYVVIFLFTTVNIFMFFM